MYKDIAVICRAEDKQSEASVLAYSIAQVCEARVAVLCLIPDLVATTVMIAPPSGAAIIPPALDALEEDKKRLQSDAKKLRGRMRDDFRALGSKFEWREVIVDEGQFGDVAAEFARSRDLTIAEACRNDPGWDAVIEKTAMQSGRPLLVSGSGYDVNQPPQSIQISWDGSAEATRAVHDALPLLTRAKKVVVVSAVEKDGDPIKIEAMQERLIRHLECHGIEAEADRISAESEIISDVLSFHADDMQADMIVMGAFGGSRIREFMFGSAASNVLSKNRRPVFLSH